MRYIVCLLTKWWAGYVFNCPDLSCECNDVCGIADELKRSWYVQPFGNCREGAILIYPYK